MKKILILVFISLLLGGCSLNISDKEDGSNKQSSETIKNESDDQAGSEPESINATPSPAIGDNYNGKMASKEPIIMTENGITFKLPGTWKEDYYDIYVDGISIWVKYTGDKDIPFFCLTVEGPVGTDVEEYGLMSDIRTIDGWVFSINYSYEINYSNLEDVQAECPHEFFTMGDYLQELLSSIKITDESQLEDWYNDYHADHLAVNSFDEAINIVKADMVPLDEKYYYFSDETTEGETDIYTVAVRRQKDTVIGAWFEVNKYSGLLRNTGGGLDLAPTEDELNVWHFPNETFIADGKNVYYIDQEYPTSINCRTCDYIGNIISDEIFSGTPHEFVTLEKVGEYLYTIDIGYVEIVKIDMATGHKDSVLPVNISFEQDLKVDSFVLDNNIIEYCLTVPADIENGSDSYNLLYDYNTSDNQFVFSGKVNNDRTY